LKDRCVIVLNRQEVSHSLCVCCRLTLTGKRKSQWCDIIIVQEEDQLKVTNYNILVCGVLTYCLWPLLFPTQIWVLGWKV